MDRIEIIIEGKAKYELYEKNVKIDHCLKRKEHPKIFERRSTFSGHAANCIKLVVAYLWAAVSDVALTFGPNSRRFAVVAVPLKKI